MSTERVLLVTEANEKIASGHLMECLVCRQYLKQRGVENDLLVNADMPAALMSRIQGSYFTYQNDIQKEIAFFNEFLNDKKYTKILFNLRKIENNFLLQIRKNNGLLVICIDEFGNRRIEADIIINPMIDKSYWQYDTEAKLYCGAEYLVLPMELQKFRKKNKKISAKIEKITVSMGGADVGDTTCRLAKWLPLLNDEWKINLVLGGAYQKEKVLKMLVEANDKIKIFYNISYLDKLFFESDLVFCAGGNTLHELAVLGIPTIVIPSMPHEVQNGKTFENAGFSLCGSIADQFSYQELMKLLERIKDKTVRKNMRDAGEKLADGKGYERIYKILSQ